jgi:small subunit ribosomal protein S4
VRKKEKFVYKVVTDEQEFKKKKRTIKINEYLSLLKLRRFYGNLRKKNFKRIFRQKGLNNNFLGRSFAYFLESRLDVILYRANFFESIYSARQFVNHKKVLVNGFVESKPGVKIYVNDIISISNYKEFYIDVKNRLIKKKIMGNYPAYLEVNYKLGLVVLTKMPEIKEIPYPFFMNIEKLAQSFLV